jgi:hypothetical protein
MNLLSVIWCKKEADVNSIPKSCAVASFDRLKTACLNLACAEGKTYCPVSGTDLP